MTASEKERVLLIDDSDSTNALIIAILRRDFAVDVATDGREALEKLKTERYGAVLLDLRIPLLDGFGVLEHLHQNNGALLRRTIIVTAAVSQRDMARVKPYPVYGVITKPFEVDSLYSAVKACCTEGGSGFGPLVSNGVILLLADLLAQRWM